MLTIDQEAYKILLHTALRGIQGMDEDLGEIALDAILSIAEEHELGEFAREELVLSLPA